MAKRGNAQLREIKKRDNRTSTKPLVCSVKGCEEDFYVYNHTLRKRYCKPHNEARKAPRAPGGNAKLLATMRSMGLIQ